MNVEIKIKNDKYSSFNHFVGKAVERGETKH
jgi:hypothetical protein